MTQNIASARNCDNDRYPAAGNVVQMHFAAKRRPVEPRLVGSPVDRDLRDFLVGKTDGESLLHALYDHVLDEPVPERLKALLRR